MTIITTKTAKTQLSSTVPKMSSPESWIWGVFGAEVFVTPVGCCVVVGAAVVGCAVVGAVDGVGCGVGNGVAPTGVGCGVGSGVGGVGWGVGFGVGDGVDGDGTGVGFGVGAGVGTTSVKVTFILIHLRATFAGLSWAIGSK